MTPLARRWRSLIALLLLAVLFFPIRRFSFLGSLPFELDPYRLVLLLGGVLWITALLVDPRMRLRRSGFEAPLVLFAAAIAGSLLANPDRVSALSGAVIRRLTLFATFLLAFYLIVNVIRELEAVNQLCKLLVAGGAALAVLAVVESQTGENLFNRLAALPLVSRSGDPEAFLRGGETRAYASAQHPIGLAAALIVLLPISVYLARHASKRWWLATATLATGAVATISRTAIVMLGVALAVLVWLRPRETWRLVPAVLVTVALVQLLIPGAFTQLQAVLFPEGGVESEVSANARLSDLAPSTEEFERQPFLGQGMGTRVAIGPNANALLLDNQWLQILLETGIVGLLAVAWLLLGFVLRAARAGRADDSARGWLLSSLAASTAAFAAGMATFDAFAFVQVTFLAIVLLAFGAVLLQVRAPTREPALADARLHLLAGRSWTL